MEVYTGNSYYNQSWSNRFEEAYQSSFSMYLTLDWPLAVLQHMHIQLPPQPITMNCNFFKSSVKMWVYEAMHLTQMSKCIWILKMIYHMAIVYCHGFQLIVYFYVASRKKPVIGYRSVGVGDKKPINRLSIYKCW